jgi:tRNA nucleotidyltransferase/poly(A) polymerase
MFDQSILKHMMIPSAIISVVKIIEHHGFEAFIVGGAIRDAFFGRVPNEFDLATNATPSDISNWFHVVSDAGKKYGTITIRHERHIVEITTYRQDADYTNGRHPETVVFSSTIMDDLTRRDFTMNALAYSPITGQFIDNFGGVEHIRSRRLVCVGKPLDRFSDDMLRPFRCFRFMAQLGLVVSPSICHALATLSTRLVLPSMLRIRHEMDRLLMGQYWQSALGFMQKMGWWDPIISAVPSAPSMPLPNDRLFRWAWALSGTNLPEVAKKLEFSKADIRFMAHVLTWQFDEAAIYFNVNDLCVTSTELIQMGFQGPALGQVQGDLVRLIREKKLNHNERDVFDYLNNRHSQPE